MGFIFYLMSIVAGLFGGVGDIMLAKWAKQGGTFLWIVGGVVCWNLALFMFFFMLVRGYSLAYSAAFFSVANSSIILLMSIVMFKESFPPMVWFGIVLSFTGLIIAEIYR